jgi:hypothetical protein
MEFMMNASGVECCFCAKSILETRVDPCDITIIVNSEIKKPKKERAEQFFWCHFECLKERLYPTTRGFLMAPAPSEDDES